MLVCVCVCARASTYAHTRARKCCDSPWPTLLANVHESKGHRQAVSQADKRFPRGNAGMTASCAVISGSSAIALGWPTTFYTQSVTGRRETKMLLGRHKVTPRFCNHPCTRNLHHRTICKPRRRLSLSSLLHGSWSLAQLAAQTHCSLERAKTESSRNSPPRHACHLQPPTHLDRWYAWGRHFILRRLTAPQESRPQGL